MIRGLNNCDIRVIGLVDHMLENSWKFYNFFISSQNQNEMFEGRAVFILSRLMGNVFSTPVV